MTGRAPQSLALGDLLRRRLPDGTRPADVLVRAEGEVWAVCAVAEGGALRAARWEDGGLVVGGPITATGLVSLRHDVLDELPEDRRRDVRGHIEQRPHRPRWRRWGTRRA